ncbi:MAG: hypothetical protein Q4D29_10960 [Lachnospiraceae bacterium]|nr:hypothetical protein [Lachnospiraceae bacterium]
MKKTLKKFLILLMLFIITLSNNGTVVLASEINDIIQESAAETAEQVPEDSGGEPNIEELP